MNKLWRKVLIGGLVLLFVAGAGFVLWATNPAQPEQQAFDSLQSDFDIRFEQVEGWLVFSPNGSEPTTGLIFFPGGRVDYRAYAPHARDIAAGGFTVVIVPLRPLNLAVSGNRPVRIGINRAGNVINTFSGIEQWVVGGHSLGGAMAAEFASNNPNVISGLMLWASYPGGNTDLSAFDLPVLSVFASNDGLATLEDIDDSRDRLPEWTSFVEDSRSEARRS